MKYFKKIEDIMKERNLTKKEVLIKLEENGYEVDTIDEAFYQEFSSTDHSDLIVLLKNINSKYFENYDEDTTYAEIYLSGCEGVFQHEGKICVLFEEIEY